MSPSPLRQLSQTGQSGWVDFWLATHFRIVVARGGGTRDNRRPHHSDPLISPARSPLPSMAPRYAQRRGLRSDDRRRAPAEPERNGASVLIEVDTVTGANAKGFFQRAQISTTALPSWPLTSATHRSARSYAQRSPRGIRGRSQILPSCTGRACLVARRPPAAEQHPRNPPAHGRSRRHLRARRRQTRSRGGRLARSAVGRAARARDPRADDLARAGVGLGTTATYLRKQRANGKTKHELIPRSQTPRGRRVAPVRKPASDHASSPSSEVRENRLPLPRARALSR